jgi:hypothetical protein
MDEPGGLPSALLGVAASHDVARAYVHCNIESVLAARKPSCMGFIMAQEVV